jgi:hypothetical protein
MIIAFLLCGLAPALAQTTPFDAAARSAKGNSRLSYLGTPSDYQTAMHEHLS